MTDLAGGTPFEHLPSGAMFFCPTLPEGPHIKLVRLAISDPYFADITTGATFHLSLRDDLVIPLYDIADLVELAIEVLGIPPKDILDDVQEGFERISDLTRQNLVEKP